MKSHYTGLILGCLFAQTILIIMGQPIKQSIISFLFSFILLASILRLVEVKTNWLED